MSGRVIARLFLVAALIWMPSFAAEPTSTPRIGVLLPSLTNSPLEEGLRDGLREAGYIEGRNIMIEWRRYSGAENDILEAARDLVQSEVELIVAVGSPATQVALQATTRPVVFTVVGDPVATGFASNDPPAKPGALICEPLKAAKRDR